MSNEPRSAPPEPAAPPGSSEAVGEHAGHAEAKRKKHDKVRSAWISFVGRIVAQIMGAAATIVLGLVVLNKYSSAPHTAPVQATAPATVAEPRSRRPQPGGEIDLAVLPLRNLAPAPGQEYFADGMTDAIIANLARIDGLHVISRTSSMQFKDRPTALPQIAADLGVDLVVEGSVAHGEGRVRITAELIDAATDAHVWARTYDRPLRDVLALQAEVAAAIAAEVNATLSPALQVRLASATPVDPGLYDLYLKGRHAWHLRTPASLQDAIRLFELALAKDPAFAPAHAGLAEAYVLLSLSVYGTRAPADALEHARSSAERALALDDSLAEAHAALAIVRQRLDWDWAAADRAFARALELKPGYAPAHQWYSIFLDQQNRHRQALGEALFAVELDPLSPHVHRTLSLVHYFGRHYADGARAGRRALELDPASPTSRVILAWNLIALGKAREAADVCEHASAGAGMDQMLATLAHAYYAVGRRHEAEQTRHELMGRDASPAALIRVHLARGDADAALDALERAYVERSEVITSLAADPMFARLRTNERYQALLQRLYPTRGSAASGGRARQ